MKILKLYTVLITAALPCLLFAAIPVVDFAALAQLAHQLDQMREQTRYIENSLRQLSNTQYDWSNAQQLINKLGKIVDETDGIAYTAQNFDQIFRKAYPGYQAPNDYNAEYKHTHEKTMQTLNGNLKALNLNARDFENENTRLQFLQKQAQNAKGQTQAIQASSQIASEMVSQIQLLRQTVIAQTHAQDVYYASQLQNDASLHAAVEKLVKSGSTEIPRYGSYQPLHVPE
jgi:P-type conjugative transfer protein TrbJ